ncbi:MAG: hypothetical protein K5739_02345 [Lachnospiraceae bacterium]|nr:hypothetical protein [Lachnospiraceae bacterium]
MKKVNKGMYGYLEYQKKAQTFKTILFFIIPLSLFIAGLITTGTDRNLLTIIAVLGFLPASKSAVLMIMYLKSHGIDQAAHTIVESTCEKVRPAIDAEGDGNFYLLYDFVFTTQDETYEIPAVFLYGGSLCGYIHPKQKERIEQAKGKKEKDVSKTLLGAKAHLESCLKKEGMQVNVKIFDDIKPFTKRLLELKEIQNAEDAPNKAIARVLYQISL